MKVDGYIASSVQIEACIERMKAAPFTREDLTEVAVAVGVPKLMKQVREPAVRLALRLIQKHRAMGDIEQYERRLWRWRRQFVIGRNP